MMMGETNVVPLFKSFEELQADEAQIMADFHAEIDAAEKMLKHTHAVLRGDTEALAKIDVVDRGFAKAEADRLLAENAKYGSSAVALAKGQLQIIVATAVRDALLKRNCRMFGLDGLAKRSARHAAAMARRPAGSN